MFQRSQKVQSANHKLKNKKYECSPIGIYTAVLTEWKLSNETQLGKAEAWLRHYALH